MPASLPSLRAALGAEAENKESRRVVQPIVLRQQLEHRVLTRTGRRVRQLAIEVGPEEVILRGLTSTYHLKQLAQEGVRDLLPGVRLQNAIVVEPHRC
jgi:hypothetical protein